MIAPRESKTRSAVKALTWRVLATLTTFAVAYFLTGRLDAALSISMLEVSLKLLLYFGHERVWQRSEFGCQPQEPAVLWFTGLSGSGKTTIGKVLTEKLRARGLKVAWLDGDITREFLPNTGFSKTERDAHVVRTGFIARSLEENGIFVVATYISPYVKARQQVRDMCRRFIEIHVATPLGECERRDAKGLYAKARKGLIKQFTGINDPYEAPEQPDIIINTQEESPDAASSRILAYLGI